MSETSVTALMVLGPGPEHKLSPGPATFSSNPLRSGDVFTIDKLVLTRETLHGWRIDSVFINGVPVEFTCSLLEASSSHLEFSVKHAMTCEDVIAVNATNMTYVQAPFVACIMGHLVKSQLDTNGDLAKYQPDVARLEKSGPGVSTVLGHAYDRFFGEKMCESVRSAEETAAHDVSSHGLEHLKCPSCLIRIINREEATLQLLRTQLLTCFGKAGS